MLYNIILPLAHYYKYSHNNVLHIKSTYNALCITSYYHESILHDRYCILYIDLMHYTCSMVTINVLSTIIQVGPGTRVRVTNRNYYAH
jgi:hypothetical protein